MSIDRTMEYLYNQTNINIRERLHKTFHALLGLLQHIVHLNLHQYANISTVAEKRVHIV